MSAGTSVLHTAKQEEILFVVLHGEATEGFNEIRAFPSGWRVGLLESRLLETVAATCEVGLFPKHAVGYLMPSGVSVPELPPIPAYRFPLAVAASPYYRRTSCET